MQVLDDGTAAQVEQVLALADVAGSRPLPVADMRQIVFHGRTLAQFGPTGRGQLPLTEFLKQALVRMDSDATPGCTGSAALAERTCPAS